MEQKANKLSWVNSPFVTLVNIILSISGYITSLFTQSKILGYISLGVLVLYIITITIYVISRYFSSKKYKSNLKEDYNNKEQKIFDYSHQISTQIVECALKVKNQKVRDDAHFQTMIKSLCSNIRYLLNSMVNIELNVCIKKIKTDSLMDSNYIDWKTITVARCCDFDNERSKADTVPQAIIDNTSFKMILTNNSPYWASPDLKNTKESFKKNCDTYKNPDPNYEDYYNSTIVVPICIKASDVSKKVRKLAENHANDQHHYLGFLCVDSKQTFNENSMDFKNLIKLIQIFGSSMYPIFENRLINELISIEKQSRKDVDDEL